MTGLVATAIVTLATPTAELPESLRRGVDALKQLQVDEAIDYLEKARTQGPYKHSAHVLLYQNLGIAYAYAGNKPAARAAFAMLLALDPGHAIAYTLTPRVTFLFQEARRKAAQQRPATLELTWPPVLGVAEPVSVFVEVVADPAGFLQKAALYSRRKGAPTFGSTPLRLAPPGGASRVDLGVVAPDATSAEALELFLVAKDALGSEVLLVGDQHFPRQINLSYEEPLPWYKRWWVWAIAGAVATGAGAAIIYAATYQPPREIGGSLVVE